MLHKFACLLLLIPAALSTVEISFAVQNLNTEGVKINLAGYSEASVKPCDLQVFQLSDEKVKEAVSRISGKPPDKIYYHEPTPDNVYEKMKWKPVKLTLRPHNFKTTSFYVEPVTLVSQQFSNVNKSSTKYEIVMQCGFIRNIFLNIWDDRVAECVTDKMIKFMLDLSALDVTGKAFTPADLQYGGGSISGSLDQCKPALGSVNVAYGQIVEATLTAKRVYARTVFNYKIELSGDIYCRYNEPLGGQRDQKHSVNTVVKELKLPRSIFVRAYTLLNITVSPNLEVTDYVSFQKVKFIDHTKITVPDAAVSLTDYNRYPILLFLLSSLLLY